MPLGALGEKLGKIRVPGVSVFSELTRFVCLERGTISVPE